MIGDVAKRIEAPGPKRILSLDGGGVRGLMSAAALVEIERKLAARASDPSQFRLADYFDFIGGTSTGAIIATWLALGRDASSLVDLYRELCPRIFKRGGLRLSPITSVFDSRRFEQALAEQLGDASLGEADWKSAWMAVAKRVDTASPWLLTNNPRGAFWGDQSDGATGNSRYMLRKVVQASASAPHFFDTTPIEIKEGEPAGVFFDGAVTPHNNPSLAMLMAARLAPFGFSWPGGRDHLLLVSIGTGWARPRVDARAFRKSWSIHKTIHALHTLILDTNDWATTVLQALSEPAAPWRINSEVGDMAGARVIEGEALAFERIDARFEREWLSDRLGLSFSERETRRLVRIDDAGKDNLKRLEQVGAALGAAVDVDALFPPRFDPAGFRVVAPVAAVAGA